jgi:hypothetical protein
MSTWFVEELRTNPRSQTRVPLQEFRRSELGRKLLPQLGEALKTAGVS